MLLTLTVRSLASLLGMSAGHQRLTMYDVPRFVLEKLGLRGLVVDTSLLKGWNVEQIDQLRISADQSGCPCLLLRESFPVPVLNPRSPQAEPVLDRVELVARAAHRLGCNAMSLTLEPVRNQMQLDFAAMLLRQVMERIDRMELNLLVEPGEGLLAKPGTLIDLVKKVGGFRIGTLPSFSMAQASGNCVEALRQTAPYASAVLASWPLGDEDPDDELDNDESDALDPAFDHAVSDIARHLSDIARHLHEEIDDIADEDHYSEPMPASERSAGTLPAPSDSKPTGSPQPPREPTRSSAKSQSVKTGNTKKKPARPSRLSAPSTAPAPIVEARATPEATSPAPIRSKSKSKSKPESKPANRSGTALKSPRTVGKQKKVGPNRTPDTSGDEVRLAGRSSPGSDSSSRSRSSKKPKQSKSGNNGSESTGSSRKKHSALPPRSRKPRPEHASSQSPAQETESDEVIEIVNPDPSSSSGPFEPTGKPQARASQNRIEDVGESASADQAEVPTNADDQDGDDDQAGAGEPDANNDLDLVRRISQSVTGPSTDPHRFVPGMNTQSGQSLMMCVRTLQSVGYEQILAIDFIGTGDPVRKITRVRQIIESMLESG